MQPGLRVILPLRVLLSLGAIACTLLVAEAALRILDQPRVLKAHDETRRFKLTNSPGGTGPVYVNYPGRLTFTYDGNPRGYFTDLDQVHHHVNATGFRGPPFTPKAPGDRRLVFLGDSFTFGEGVRDADTYAEVAATTLTTPTHRVEAINLGVGGYNTSQSATVLKTIGLALEPDAVILGYTPNDAEPPLFRIDPQSGQPVRRNREALVAFEGAPQHPPATGLYRLRLARLFWLRRTRARLTKQTIDYYHSLYRDDREGWEESQRALREIVTTCTAHDIPCIVVMFPVLVDLNAGYPFAGIHSKVGSVVREAGGTFVDLLPALEGMGSRELWVHPTDQHPNQQVHAIAGERVAQALSRIGGAQP